MASKQGRWESTGFGVRLRAYREAAALSQADLAAKVGVTANTVARIERGESEPTWPVALAVADALGVGIESFRTGAELPPATVEPAATPRRGRPGLGLAARAGATVVPDRP